MSDVPDVPRDPTLNNLLDLFGEVLREGVRVMMPGVIVDYDDANQSATVQPLIQDIQYDEFGKRTTKTIPPIHDVPVMFCGPGRARITWPVAKGDHCELRFSSSCISNFIARGGTTPLDPGLNRRHDLSDAVAWVGMHSPASAPTDAPTDAMVIHLGGGIVLKLGSSGASEAAILGNSYWNAESTFLTALTTFVTAVGVHVSPSGTSPDPTLLTACGVMETAIAAFQALSATFLSLIIKLQ